MQSMSSRDKPSGCLIFFYFDWRPPRICDSFEECGVREVKEETSLDIKNVEFLTVTNNVLLDEPKPSHYEVIFMRVVPLGSTQAPQNLEPGKCGGWEWYDWDHLPVPLFQLLKTLIQTGFSPFPPI
ncbi:hypothetical protein AAC387_Pa09g1147 [Persea americana]